MIRLVLSGCALLSLLPARGMCQTTSTVIGDQVFTLPQGFEIRLVAGPPLVDRPIVADFDDLGRLYVADSAGVNDKVQVQLETKPHRIVRLEDTDGDGDFDTSTVFADKMMFPEGMLWHEGAVYCAAPPIIWKLRDTDDDGVADERTKWFDVGTLTGCANDLHGPYLGPGGWLYWTKGAFAKLDLTLGNGTKLTNSAAHIFRSRPDGSGLESFAAGGMDNPVEIAFNEAGDLFFTSTFIVQPGGGRRDGIVHGIYGAVYPKRHGVIEGISKTGDLLEAMTHLGPAAPSGLACYRSETFGENFRGNLFSTLFNMRKVMRHVLKRTGPDENGSTFHTEDSDFLVSDHVDFHPTDVLEDADGSLLVLDTGGWYKICCPTSVIAKSDVLGAIYRIRKTDSPAVNNPRGRGETLTAKHLGDPRPAVQSRIVSELAKNWSSSRSELEDLLDPASDSRAATAAIWALCASRNPAANGLIRMGLKHASPLVRQAAAHACGLERDAAAAPALTSLLESPHFAVRREAATALGRIGKSTHALMGASPYHDSGKLDETLAHSILHAILEQNEPSVARAVLDEGERRHLKQRWALRALQALQPEALNLSDTLNDSWGGVEASIARQHPEWAPELARHFDFIPKLATRPGDGDNLDGYHFSQFLHWDEVGEVARLTLSNSKTHPAAIAHVLEAIRLAKDKVSPPVVRGIEALLDHDEKAAVQGMLALHADQLTDAMRAALLRWLKAEHSRSRENAETQFGSELHSLILRAVDLLVSSSEKAAIDDKTFAILLDLLGNTGVADSGKTAQVIAKSALSPGQLMLLSQRLPSANAFTLPLLMRSFEQGGTAELGTALASALERSPAVASVSIDALERVSDAFGSEVGERILAARPSSIDAGDREAKLAETEAGLPPGDVRRGHRVFKSGKAACSACHRLAYAGGVIGPPLDRIGRIRSQKDLLEAILFPSASYARGYETIEMSFTENSEAFTLAGIVRYPRADRVELTTADGKKHNVALSQVHEMNMAPVSLMPPALDANLSRQELADLLAFLMSLK